MAALALVGMAVNAVGTYMGYQSQAAAQKAQANADRYAAAQQEAAGTQNASNAYYNTDKYTIGTAIARAASSGQGTLAGSSADVVGSLAGKNVYNAESTMANAFNSAKGLRYQAELHDFGAKQTKAAMPFALASTLVTGLSKFSSTGAFGNPNTWGTPAQSQSSPYRYG